MKKLFLLSTLFCLCLTLGMVTTASATVTYDANTKVLTLASEVLGQASLDSLIAQHPGVTTLRLQNSQLSGSVTVNLPVILQSGTVRVSSPNRVIFNKGVTLNGGSLQGNRLIGPEDTPIVVNGGLTVQGAGMVYSYVTINGNVNLGDSGTISGTITNNLYYPNIHGSVTATNRDWNGAWSGSLQCCRIDGTLNLLGSGTVSDIHTGGDVNLSFITLSGAVVSGGNVTLNTLRACTMREGSWIAGTLTINIDLGGLYRGYTYTLNGTVGGLVANSVQRIEGAVNSGGDVYINNLPSNNAYYRIGNARNLTINGSIAANNSWSSPTLLVRNLTGNLRIVGVGNTTRETKYSWSTSCTCGSYRMNKQVDVAQYFPLNLGVANTDTHFNVAGSLILENSRVNITAPRTPHSHTVRGLSATNSVLMLPGNQTRGAGWLTVNGNATFINSVITTPSLGYINVHRNTVPISLTCNGILTFTNSVVGRTDVAQAFATKGGYSSLTCNNPQGDHTHSSACYSHTCSPGNITAPVPNVQEVLYCPGAHTVVINGVNPMCGDLELPSARTIAFNGNPSHRLQEGLTIKAPNCVNMSFDTAPTVAMNIDIGGSAGGALGTFATPAGSTFGNVHARHSHTELTDCILAAGTFSSAKMSGTSFTGALNIAGEAELTNVRFAGGTIGGKATMLSCQSTATLKLTTRDSTIDKGIFQGNPALEGSTYVIVMRGTFTDYGGSRSSFSVHEDSEQQVTQGSSSTVTTVKLSNPPIIIDWEEFPLTLSTVVPASSTNNSHRTSKYRNVRSM